MIITRIDPFTQKENSQEINVTEQQLDQWRNGGRNIQDVMRHLTDDEREFIMTGIMPDSWDELFKGKEDEDLEVNKGAGDDAF